MKNKSWLIMIIFVVTDVIVIYNVFRIARKLRNLIAPFIDQLPLTWGEVEPVAQLGVLVIIGMFFANQLYPGYGLTAVKELEKMGKLISFSFVLVAMISYLVKPFHIFPRSIFPISWAGIMFTLPILRFISKNILSKFSNIYGVPVVVFAEDEWAEKVKNSLFKIARLGWRLQGSYPLEDINNDKLSYSSSIAILAINYSEKTADYIRKLNQKFRKVVLMQEFPNIGSLNVESRDINGQIALEFRYDLISLRNRGLKLLIDFVGGAIILFLFAPALLVLGILVRLDSPGPIVYKQERLGKNDSRFFIYKFRTMVVDADEILTHILADDPAAKEEFEKFHKLENDPRVTHFGKFLRKFSLDELPQLLNVLKGEMSIVGPRAYMPTELSEIGNYAPIIFRVLPGMTGWWQVLERNNATFQNRLEMDEYYISNWSTWMDYYILLKTFWVVVGGKGT